MARLELLVRLVSVCFFLMWEVRSEKTAAQVYDLLDERLNTMTAQINTIDENLRNNVALFNYRIETLEALISPNTETDEFIGNADVSTTEMNMRKALAEEKTFVLKMLNLYSGNLDEFKNTINNQMISIQRSVEATNEQMKKATKENVQEFSNSIMLIKKSVDMSNAYLKRQDEEKSLFMNNSINELQTETHSQLKDVRLMVDTSIKKISTLTEHVNASIEQLNNEVDDKLKPIKTDISKQASVIKSTKRKLRKQAKHITSVSENLHSVEEKLVNEISTINKNMTSLAEQLSSDITDVSDNLYYAEEIHESDISSIRESITLVDEKRVGFTVRLWNNMINYTHEETIVFSVVHSAYGDGYNRDTGIFTAPKTGLYLFHVTVEAYDDTTRAKVQIVVNGKYRADAIAKGEWSTGSTDVVAYMDEGQEACVKALHHFGAGPFGIARLRTYFTGFLIN